MKKNSGVLRGKRLAVVLAIVVAITAAAAVYFSLRPERVTMVKPPEEIEDYLFWQAKELTDFKLTGADKTLGLNDLKGKWSFVFFGYIHCPDVCPLTMGILGKAFQLIEQDPAAYQEVQGIFVSVDPKRDTPELIKEYASYFSGKFTGVSGEAAQLEAFSRQMSALYTIHPGKGQASGNDYEVTHNSTVFLVDPRGRLYGRFPPPHLPQEIAAAFLKIRAFYNSEGKK